MDLTDSHAGVLPPDVRERYAVREIRNAAAILRATSEDEFEEIVAVLRAFQLSTDDLVRAGGNESRIAGRLNDEFRFRGWREARVDTHVRSTLRIMPYRNAGEVRDSVRESEVFNEGYKVDNVKGRIALDVEWNAKDGNLDRDIAAYRSLYDAGIIDGAVLITRTQDDLRVLANDLAKQAGSEGSAMRPRLGTTTTTNLDKLTPRMTRGDSGGCPLLAVAISARCWQG